jgi:transcription elongation GreA/GreB family factor
MAKSEILALILERLRAELDLLTRAALATHAEATHEENKAEDKYDTRGLEASYLAHGQSRAAEEAANAVAQFQSLVLRDFATGEAIALGALVRLDDGARYFIGPKSGGTEVESDGATVMVITPSSPLGRQLVGRRQGDKITLALGGKSSERTISAVT